MSNSLRDCSRASRIAMLKNMLQDLLESTGKDPLDRLQMLILVPVVLLLGACGIALGVRVFLLVALGA